MLNLTFTHRWRCIYTAKHSHRFPSQVLWNISVLYSQCVYAAFWKMCLTTVHLSMYLPLLCATSGTDTVWYIKKQAAYLFLLSPPERKWMSPHWNWLSLIPKKQSYFRRLFAIWCRIFFYPFRKCPEPWLPWGLLMQKHMWWFRPQSEHASFLHTKLKSSYVSKFHARRLDRVFHCNMCKSTVYWQCS